MVKKSAHKEDLHEPQHEELVPETPETTEPTCTGEVTETPEEENCQQKISELNDKYLRLSAEFDNYRKRTLKEKMELTKTAGEQVLVGLLPVVDDFERAMAHMGEATDLDALQAGVQLIYNKFFDFLGQKGIREMETANQEFNTDLHEAITKLPAPDPEMKGKILDCVEKGYLLHDKVVRYAKVVVCE